MGGSDAVFAAIAVAVFAAGVLIVLTPRLMDQRGSRPIRLNCPVCQHEIQGKESDLSPLPLELVAFVVREDPATYGLPLSEVRCTGCGVHHIYATNVHPPRFLMANPLSDKVRTSTCGQCHAPLLRPAWTRGAYDGRIASAPGFSGRHGLECARCGAITCATCAEDASRGRTKDGSYLCPRCFRGPLNTIHHF